MLRLLKPIKLNPVVIQPWLPSPEDEAVIRATDATLDWLQHAWEVLRPFQGKWIAAADCRILASGETYELLMDQLEEKNMDDQPIVTLYIRKPGYVYIY